MKKEQRIEVHFILKDVASQSPKDLNGLHPKFTGTDLFLPDLIPILGDACRFPQGVIPRKAEPLLAKSTPLSFAQPWGRVFSGDFYGLFGRVSQRFFSTSPRCSVYFCLFLLCDLRFATEAQIERT